MVSRLVARKSKNQQVPESLLAWVHRPVSSIRGIEAIGYKRGKIITILTRCCRPQNCARARNHALLVDELPSMNSRSFIFCALIAASAAAEPGTGMAGSDLPLGQQTGPLVRRLPPAG